MKKNSLLLPILFASAGMMAGCDDPKSPKIRSFAASDTSLPAGGSEVTFTWDVKNASSLELLPFPGVVTGSAATVIVTEPTTFTLVAKRKSRKAKETLDILVGEAFDVVGHVVFDDDGALLPVPDITVAIGTQVVLTDAAGEFRFPDVVAPYDLVVVKPFTAFGGSSNVEVYLGVTIPNPTINGQLLLQPDTSLPMRTGTLAGTISGGVGFPEPNGETYLVSTLEGQYTTILGLGAAGYSFPVSWRSAATSVEVVHNVLQVDYATGEWDHARVAGTLAHAATLTLNPAIADVPEGTFTIDATNSWGGDQDAEAFFGLTELGLEFGTAFFLPIAENTTTGLFTISYPQLGNEHLAVEVSAFDATAYSSINYTKPTGAGVVADIPEPTRRLSPIDGAVVGAGTPFRIVRPEGQISVFQFAPSFFFGGGGGGGSYNAFVTVYTDETTIAFPDLSAIGLPLPSNTLFLWTVYSYGPWNSLDEALGQPTGHQDPPGDVRYSGGPMDDATFVTENLGDDDDDGVGVSAVRYEPVPEN